MIHFGAAIAHLYLDPGDVYYQAVADGETEAMFLKGLHEARKQMAGSK